MREELVIHTAATLSDALAKIHEAVELPAPEASLVAITRRQLSDRGGVGTDSAELERAVTAVLSASDAFERKIRASESSGQPTYGQVFGGVVPNTTSQDLAALRKRVTDALTRYIASRA